MLLDNSNEKNAELLLRVAEPALRIADDEKMHEAIEGLKSLKTKSDFLQTMGLLRFVPIILKGHKEDLYQIVAALTDKTVKEVSEQSTRETIKVVQRFLKDDDIASFFSSAEQPGNKEEKK